MTASPESLATAAAPRRARNFIFPAVVVALVVGGLALVVRSSTSGGVYDMTLGDLLGQSAAFIGKDVRVNGRIQAGTFRDLSSSDGVHVVFAISDSSGHTLNVHYRQLLPDAFEEGREVIIQGKLESVSEIECARLTVKCPSKYQDENQTGKAGQYYQNKRQEAMPSAAPTALDGAQAK